MTKAETDEDTLHRKHVQKVIYSPGRCESSACPGIQRSGAVFYLNRRYLGTTSSPDSRNADNSGPENNEIRTINKQTGMPKGRQAGW